jgi:polar amino acid transport system substrate-binding protein
MRFPYRRRARSSARLPRIALLAAALAAPAAVLGCADRVADVDTLAKVREDGVVRVGFANEAPYAYLDSATGELTGEAPEVARLVLERMGVTEIGGRLTEFGALIPGLKAGRFDLIAAGMYIQPARCREIDFSNPTYCIGEGLLVAARNPLDLHSYDDVRESDARLGVVAGTVELGYARDSGIRDERIVVFPDAPSAVAGVETGRVDAYAGTELTVRDLLTKADDPDLAMAEPFADPVIDGEPARGCGAFGFRAGDDAFREEFERHLAELLGTPEHLAAVEPFGFGEATLPGGLTAEALCAGGTETGAGS